MRIKVGRVVNLHKDVNLADLSPLDRIIASATNAYKNTTFYRRRFAETQEKKEERIRKVKEALINNLLSIVSQQLKQNILLKDKGDRCVGVLLKVPSRFAVYLQEVLQMQEFLQYDIKIIHPSQLAQKFAKNCPTLLYIENKGIEADI